MRLVLVRHGEPNYQLDCLTEKGRLQAAAAAQRLQEEGIAQVFASTMGRAQETAHYFADPASLPVTVLPFMREIHWGAKPGKTVAAEGHPWTLGRYMVENGQNFFASDWRLLPDFADNVATAEADAVGSAGDAWLEGFGYRREGSAYRCLDNAADDTVALFSHGGSSTALLARLLNLPFPYLCHVLQPDFTAISVLHFPCVPGQLVLPRLETACDDRHIHGV